jgi:transcriptional regulator with XRE-family HTH domain
VTPEIHAARVLLCAKRVTQEQVAACLGISTGMLSRVLNGHRHSPDLVKALWLVLTSREAK